jgi:hypothetical protein
MSLKTALGVSRAMDFRWRRKCQSGSQREDYDAFGSIEPENLNGADTSDVATFTPATGSESEAYDGNQSGGSPGLDNTTTHTYSIDSTGLGMFPSGCSISVTPPTCKNIFYVISPTKRSS